MKADTFCRCLLTHPALLTVQFSVSQSEDGCMMRLLICLLSGAPRWSLAHLEIAIRMKDLEPQILLSCAFGPCCKAPLWKPNDHALLPDLHLAWFGALHADS